MVHVKGSIMITLVLTVDKTPIEAMVNNRKLILFLVYRKSEKK